ncbi:MAG: hypothetical protein NZ108_06420, partial [Bacteroidia bacterium]|nr:hypothetical protein [Bacteroidia bacterium]
MLLFSSWSSSYSQVPAWKQWYSVVRKPVVFSKNKPPILFLLHGYKRNENHILEQFQWLPGEWYVVAIRGCLPLAKSAWCYYDVSEDRMRCVPATQREIWQHLSEWIKQKTKELGADTNQVYLAGFSQGAM